MVLIVLRGVFLMVATGIGVFFVRSNLLPADWPWTRWFVFGGILAGAGLIILCDVLVRR